MIEIKCCTICKVSKSVEDFYKTSSNSSGYMSACKTCESDRKKSVNSIKHRKDRYKANRSHIIKYNSNNRKKNWNQYQLTAKKYYENNKLKALQQGWKQKGILNKNGEYFTLRDYTHVLESQGGVCAICKSDGKSHKKGLVVDHDHKTGVYRGILCAFCNTALSYFKDNPDILTKAINYLK